MDRHVKAGDGANVGIGERSHDAAEIVGLNANIAVADDQDFVLRFVDKAREFGHFVVGGDAAGAVEHANLALGKVVDELLDDRQYGIVGIAHAKEDFVVGIILAAEAGEIFVGVGIEAANRLEIADRRREIRVRLAGRALAKVIPGAVQGKQVIDERNGRDR